MTVAVLVTPLTTYASDALGHDLSAADTTLSAGTELAAGTFWSDTYSDLRQENYVVYTPNARVTPVVTDGGTARSLTTVLNAAKSLEEQGYRVVAGINGDYYSVQYGMPVGSTMVNGVLRNANSDPHYAVGFRADGTAVIGDPKLSLYASTDGGGFDVFAFNHLRHSEYGVFLYDHAFNDRGTTGTSEPGVDVLCSVEDGALTIGGELVLRVEEVLFEATDTAVPEGQYVLTANLKAEESYTAPLLALQAGDRITLSVSSGAENGAWGDVVNLVGAPELLVENGVVCSGLPTGSAPRTAIGQRADGSLIFYTIDGRQSGYSIGASLTAVGMRLLELGCVTAVALDGGGSTTLVATLPNETSARVVNTPSEGSQRAVSNHIFLVASNQASGTLDHIYLRPSASKALPGARVPLTASAVDSNYIPMDSSVTLRSDKGSIVSGILTLADMLGAVNVTASSGGKSAAASIEVTAPDSIVVKRGGNAITSLTISPNSSVSLTAQGISNHLVLAGDNSCFTWSYEGDGVTLSDGGSTLTAGKDAGAGTLTVSIGEKSVSIPVTVAVVPFKTGADFETAFGPLVSEDGRTALTRDTAASRVHNGHASARLDYTALPSDDAAFDASVVAVNYPIPDDYDTWSMWYLADAQCAFDVIYDNGARLGGMEYRFDDSGWKLAAGKVPAGAHAIVGIAGFYGPESETGTIWLDQLVFSYGDVFDESAPEVSLTFDAESNMLAGRAFDAVDGAALAKLSLACDGKALDYVRDSRTGVLSAALPEPDGLAHRVTLTAGDTSGNLARTSVSIPAAADAEPAFPDTTGHWANAYVEYLKRTGISNGSDGRFHPDANITRQEFAVMLYRYLAPSGDFDAVELPFADSAQIASWALPAARAMYALGVVTGSIGSGGRLYCNPGADISRQEAMTMLGRLLEKGYAAPELVFTDSASIPAWSADHIRVLSALGVLGGYEDGSFRPTAPMTRAQVAAVLFRLN